MLHQLEHLQDASRTVWGSVSFRSASKPACMIWFRSLRSQERARKCRHRHQAQHASANGILIAASVLIHSGLLDAMLLFPQMVTVILLSICPHGVLYTLFRRYQMSRFIPGTIRICQAFHRSMPTHALRSRVSFLLSDRSSPFPFPVSALLTQIRLSPSLPHPRQQGPFDAALSGRRRSSGRCGRYLQTRP